MNGGGIDHQQDTATTQDLEEVDLDQEAMNVVVTDMTSSEYYYNFLCSVYCVYICHVLVLPFLPEAFTGFTFHRMLIVVFFISFL